MTLCDIVTIIIHNYVLIIIMFPCLQIATLYYISSGTIRRDEDDICTSGSKKTCAPAGEERVKRNIVRIQKVIR